MAQKGGAKQATLGYVRDPQLSIGCVRACVRVKRLILVGVLSMLYYIGCLAVSLYMLSEFVLCCF